MINERISELYNQFEAFPPRNPIVRLGIKDDAFVLVVFELLFQEYHNTKKLDYNNEFHRELITQSIVPPPDSGIDIFYEEIDIDESKYHIVQVKNCVLTPDEISTCFLKMEYTIKIFFKKPKDLHKNIREIITKTGFTSQSKTDITYYVVHKGEAKYIRNQRSNQVIISSQELEILQQGARHKNVPFHIFNLDISNNFIVNNFIEADYQVPNKNLPKSLLCNLNGYDLAKLNNLYSNTLLGRNILYGQNLRESLNKHSKTFEKMFETIDTEPDLFLFYNNGITIISSYFNPKKDGQFENITVKDFSIINGAQTTSTLGAYLRKAESENELEKIENLKKVFVLTKIYEISGDLPNHEKISERIKLYNNTQTPLSSRDMVSIRPEQFMIQQKFFSGNAPNIFIHIKKGVETPDYPKTYPHQQISNEILAQLVLCGFFVEPFTAKDKKTKIFDNEGKEKVTLNDIYHKIFDENDGILFQKSKVELDELLLVYKLHEDTKKFQKNYLKEQLDDLNHNPAKDDFDRKNKEDSINKVKRNMEISNVCLFFNVANYFVIKRSFDKYVPGNSTLIFDYKRYYNDKDFKKKMVIMFLNLFFSKTVEIIRKNSGNENVTNWLRVEKNEKIFLSMLQEKIMDEGITTKESYYTFVNYSKIPVIIN